MVTSFESSSLEGLRLIPAEFFGREPDEVARDLLGCILMSGTGEEVMCGGVIVETEAYLGSDDPGSHAATRGITKRNEMMYRGPGTVYVYLTYGVHHMLNIVCGPEGTAGAVLIRALRPVTGVDLMRTRRGVEDDCDLCSGPGKLASALGVDLQDNGSRLGSGRLIVYAGEVRQPDDIAVSGRVGLAAGYDLQLRYFIRGDSCVSRGRTGPPIRESP